MPTMFESAFDVWSWPLQLANVGVAMMETTLGAQRVVAARLPTIGAAMRDPLGADHVELGRMVSEKVDAFGKSGRSVAAAGDVVRKASRANAQALRTMGAGGFLWPADWIKIAESNMAAAAALVALPGAALAPIQSGVAANDRRLRA